MLFIFDLDDTLTHEGFDDVPGVFVFDETVAILQLSKDAGHTMAVASHNARALEILTKNGLDRFFERDLIQVYDHADKLQHLKRIRELCGDLSADGCVYFDDLEVHVGAARDMGMRADVCCHVTGLTISQVRRFSY